MDELVTHMVATTGISPEVARKATVVILRFLAAEGPPAAVAALIDALPGAREALAESPGGGSAGLMGAFNDLMAAGVGFGAVEGVARSFGEEARKAAGDETVNAVIAGIPGLGQLV